MTISIWTYLQNQNDTKLIGFEGGPSIERKTGNLSLGCQLGQTVQLFSVHFASYQINEWQQVSCIFTASSISLSYGLRWSAANTSITDTLDLKFQTLEIGGLGNETYFLRQIKVWNTDLTYGQILQTQQQSLRSFSSPSLILYIGLNGDTHSEGLSEISTSLLHFIPALDSTISTSLEYSWLSPGQQAPMICNSNEFMVLGVCQKSMHFINFSSLSSVLTTQVKLLNNPPDTTAAYELWAFMFQSSQINWLFHHNSISALGITQNSILILQSTFLQTSNSTHPSSFIPRKWHYVALRLQGNIINLLLDDQVQTINGINTTPNFESGNLTLGYHPNYNSSYFQGYMAQLRIWKTRQFSQLLQFSHRSINPSLSTLLGYWKLLPINEEILPDLTSHGNHFSLTNIYVTTAHVSQSLPICQNSQIYKGSHCDDRIYTPLISPQLGGSAELSLKIQDTSAFSFSFYFYLASSGVSPSNIYFMMKPQIKIHHNLTDTEVTNIDVCGATTQHTAQFDHDKWLRFTFFTNSSASFYILGQSINTNFTANTTCTSPLQLSILNPNSSVSYEGVYMRDLVFYPSTVHATQLIRASYTHSFFSLSQIDVFYPLSIPERSLKNRAESVYSFQVLEYADPHRSSLSTSLYSNMDIYRWKYIESISDQITTCDYFYILKNGYCQQLALKYLERNRIVIQSSALPDNFKNALATAQLGVAAWIRYTNATLDQTQTIVQVATATQDVISGELSQTDYQVSLLISPGSQTVSLWSFQNFKDNWNYIGLVRSNTSLAYSINGKYSQIDQKVESLASAQYSLSISDTGTSQFLGVIARVSILRNSISELLFLQDMFLQAISNISGQTSSETISGTIYPIMLTNQIDNKVYGINGQAGLLDQHSFSLAGSYFQSVQPITSFISGSQKTHPLFTQVFKTSLNINYPGAMGVWLLVTEASSDYLLFLTLYTSETQINRWVQIFLKSKGTTLFEYQSTQSVELAHSMTMGQWCYLQFHATPTQMVGILSERMVHKTISQSLPSLEAPIVLQLSPVSVITKYSFQHFRVYSDDLSDTYIRVDYFSNYLQLSHKSLSSYPEFGSFTSVQTNLVFHYLIEIDGTNYFALMNNTASAPFTVIESTEIVTKSSPVQCSIDQTYNGIGCQNDKSQLLFTNRTKPLELIIPTKNDNFTTFAWLYVSEFVSNQIESFISFLDKDGSSYFSLGASQTNSSAQVLSSQQACLSESSSVILTLKQWLSIIISIQNGQPTLHTIEQSFSFPKACWSLSVNFQILQAFGLLTQSGTIYRRSHGSLRNLAIFSAPLSITEIRSYLEGAMPDPLSQRQSTALQSFYYLDGTDISSNQELILNQASGEWEAFGRILTNSISPDAVPRFASSRVLTLLNIQQLPTCVLGDGLYLDTSLKLCKQVQHTVLSPLNSDLKFYIPPTEKNSTSWTLNFWLYYGTHQDSDYPLNLLSYKTDLLPNSISLTRNGSLAFTHNSTAMSGLRGYIFQARWNSITLACSEPARQDKCQFFPNFSLYPSDTSSAYLAPLFFTSSHELTFPQSKGVVNIALLRAWCTILGGAMSNVINSLKSVAYSQSSQSSDYLLMYYPLLDFNYFDTFKRDKISGYSQSKFSYHWLSTTFDHQTQPIGEKEERVWNITEFSIPSIQATFNSNLVTGFTMRVWFKVTKEDLSSKQGIVENINNFKLLKEEKGHYSVRQFIPDPTYHTEQVFLQMQNVIVTNTWDLVLYRLDKTKARMSAKSYSYPMKVFQTDLSPRRINWEATERDSLIYFSNLNQELLLREFIILSSPISDKWFMSSKIFSERFSS